MNAMLKYLFATILFAGLLFTKLTLRAQALPEEIKTALMKDDTTSFNKLINKQTVNQCYHLEPWDYSLLSLAIKTKAIKCFKVLIDMGANVNIICNGYVPPLMHASKYGTLEMVKLLVTKGADFNYRYDGLFEPAKGKIAIEYAEANHQDEIAYYLRSLKK